MKADIICELKFVIYLRLKVINWVIFFDLSTQNLIKTTYAKSVDENCRIHRKDILY